MSSKDDHGTAASVNVLSMSDGDGCKNNYANYGSQCCYVRSPAQIIDRSVDNLIFHIYAIDEEANGRRFISRCRGPLAVPLEHYAEYGDL
jgi:hypothetical protein